MKNKKRVGFIIAGVTAVSAMAVTGVSLYANASMKVNSYTVVKDSLSQAVELNGTVESEKSQTMYAGVDAKVQKVHVKVGDAVKKGDLLVSFDEEKIDYLISMTELDVKASEGNYKNTIEQGNRVQALYNEATINLGVLNQQIADTQNKILDLEKRIADKKAAYAGEGAALQKSIIDTNGKIADKDKDKETEDKTDYSAQLANLQKLAQGSAYNQQYDEDILKMQEELNRLSTDLANFQAYKAEMTSQKAATETARLTAGQRELLDANREITELSAEEKIKNLTLAKEGIRAEFDGIVTGVDVVEGAEISRGMSLITVSSSKDIIVKCSANKYDINSIEEGQTAVTKIGTREYTGKVTRVERMAGTDPSRGANVGVDVRIDNPGSDIILGLETKAKVGTAEVDDVICVPNGALVEEGEETYVFVEKDKKAIRKKVEAGIKNDDMIEVTSGLKEGEVVVWNDETELKDGMDIRISNQ